MAVMIYSTNAPIDRMIPKGVVASLASDAPVGTAAGPNATTS